MRAGAYERAVARAVAKAECICDGKCPMTEDRHWVNCPAHAHYAAYLAVTTPSQGLDAATVERDEATTEAIRRLQFKADFQRGYGADWFSLDRADADLILAALATDPHQHGGKGA